MSSFEGQKNQKTIRGTKDYTVYILYYIYRTIYVMQMHMTYTYIHTAALPTRYLNIIDAL
jgi:hypothetical protein